MTEMELAMAIGMNFKRTNNLEQSLQMRRAYSDLSYLDAVGHFVAHYGGGAEHGFPIVKLLATIEKSFSSSMLLGEEFFLNAVGAAVPSDIDRVRAASNKDKLMPAEMLAQMNLETLQKCALLAKKEGKGRESKQYGSLDESSKAYIGELIAMDKDAGEKAAKTAGVDLASLDAVIEEGPQLCFYKPLQRMASKEESQEGMSTLRWHAFFEGPLPLLSALAVFQMQWIASTMYLWLDAINICWLQASSKPSNLLCAMPPGVDEARAAGTDGQWRFPGTPVGMEFGLQLGAGAFGFGRRLCGGERKCAWLEADSVLKSSRCRRAYGSSSAMMRALGRPSFDNMRSTAALKALQLWSCFVCP
ncbi:unnamed protein product [Durusdinium trenchii]|uniref:Uncharacterized protein n=1 Tax=Durusdinium trenchii TaxID=1381693 RepID=A0ABP0MNW4_9DINO